MIDKRLVDFVAGKVFQEFLESLNNNYVYSEIENGKTVSNKEEVLLNFAIKINSVGLLLQKLLENLLENEDISLQFGAYASFDRMVEKAKINFHLSESLGYKLEGYMR
jgi:hypothetical protein